MGVEEQKRLDFYVEKFANHNRDETHAQKLVTRHKEYIMKLHNEKQYPDSELKFFLEANDILVQCRNTLKWSYAYAYYCITYKNPTKKNFFEFSQTDLENYCNRLHTLLTEDCEKFLNEKNNDRSPFYKYRATVTSMMQSLVKFQEGVTKMIEDDNMQIGI